MRAIVFGSVKELIDTYVVNNTYFRPSIVFEKEKNERFVCFRGPKSDFLAVDRNQLVGGVFKTPYALFEFCVGAEGS